MSRRCGSSKPTPTPVNGKATKPAKYLKIMKGTPSLKGQEEIVNDSKWKILQTTPPVEIKHAGHFESLDRSAY